MWTAFMSALGFSTLYWGTIYVICTLSGYYPYEATSFVLHFLGGLGAFVHFGNAIDTDTQARWYRRDRQLRR